MICFFATNHFLTFNCDSTFVILVVVLAIWSTLKIGQIDR